MRISRAHATISPAQNSLMASCFCFLRANCSTTKASCGSGNLFPAPIPSVNPENRLTGSEPPLDTLTHSCTGHPALKFPSLRTSHPPNTTMSEDSSIHTRTKLQNRSLVHHFPAYPNPTTGPTHQAHSEMARNTNRTRQLEVPKKEGLKGVLKTTVRHNNLNRKHTTRFFLCEGLATRPRVFRS